MRVCSTCDIEKPLSDYYSDGKGGKKARCKECEKKAKRNEYVPVRKVNKDCAGCGKTFKGFKNKKYCSRKCYYRSNIFKHNIVCKGCGSKAEVRSYDAEYCCHECYYKYGDHSNKGIHTDILVECDTCSNEFRANSSQSKYCSDECNPVNWSSWYVWFNECSYCNSLFTTSREGTLYCSNECSKKQQKTEYWLSQPKIKCCNCKSLFQPEYNKSKRYCSKSCAKEYKSKSMYRSMSGKDHVARAKKYNVYYEKVDKIKVFERDKWKCQHCGTNTPKALAKTNGNEDNEPTLDHVIPMSRGGSHSYYNTQLLCRKCNLNKGNEYTKQVPLQFNQISPYG